MWVLLSVVFQDILGVHHVDEETIGPCRDAVQARYLMMRRLKRIVAEKDAGKSRIVSHNFVVLP